MEYISADEIAKKWDISLRQVQRLLAANRIRYAKKLGRSWMIPIDAEKPTDMRLKKKAPQKSLWTDLNYVINNMVVTVMSDNPDAVFDALTDKRMRNFCEGAFSYARGDFTRTIYCYKQSEGDEAAKLCTSFYAIAAAISIGDYHFYTEIERFLKDIIEADDCREVTAIAELSLATAHLSAMAPNLIPDWLKEGDFSAIPLKIRLEAVFKRVQYLRCLGEYQSMLDIAQTALVFFDSPQEISHPCTYLKLMCAVACYALERQEEAEHWLLDTMKSNLPHGFITPFAELISPLGGLMEKCLKQHFPMHYNKIIGQWNFTFKNWVIFHNRFTKDNITSILSLRDYQMAMMAVRGISNAKIAEQFNISVGRLKIIMSGIYGKLFIKNRKELAKYIL